MDGLTPLGVCVSQGCGRILVLDKGWWSLTRQERRAARAQGVGPKLAQRICNELKDKVGGLGTVVVGSGPALRPAPGPQADALSALAALGFKPAEASAAVAAASDELGPAATLDALVRLALRKAG